MANARNDQPAACFERVPLAQRFCNIDRLWYALEARGLDAIVATSPSNVFYLSGFNGIAHKSDEPRPYAVILSRHAPEHPIIVIADYYVATFLTQPTWIEDVRPFRAVMMGLDRAPQTADIDRFIPADGVGVEWVENARQRYAFDMGGAVQAALKDLALAGKRVAFDDVGFGLRLGLSSVEIADGYDPLMFARAVKTATELALIERATRLNQAAIERTVTAWEKGITWRQLNARYHQAAIELGGFVRDPGGMVWGHPCGAQPTITLQTGLEDFVVEAGTHVMFDCHGTLDLYCWDGGKTWVVDGEPEGDAQRYLQATGEVAQALLSAMRPGARVSELQTLGREVYRKAGVPDADSALIFFHGLGLSHMDLELTTADGEPIGDWALEQGMVVPLHLLYPGGERERSWLEDVVVVTADGGRPLFSWGFGPLTGS
ncbi:MAG: M24 family metallopeptidase [Gammaproteobacteria bacterium]|nr:M24 family metallopeptidase [Gammaproteobacteria bacterium]